MRKLGNVKLTANFSLYEIIEGSLPLEAVRLNWQNIHQYEAHAFNWAALARNMQHIRAGVNKQFPQEKEIGLRITSGFRCIEWELLRGRSGGSQHRFGAVDVQPTNCDNEKAVQIIKWLHKKQWHTRGWFGGFAIKEPQRDKDGVIQQVGFAHFDVRGYVARWTYK